VSLEPPWKPGQSGNPNGRPASQVLRWFEEYQWVAFSALVRNTRQGSNLAASNTAAIYIHDRVLGRPTQAVEATVSTDLGLQHLLAVSEFNGAPIFLEGQAEAQDVPYEPEGDLAPPGALVHEQLALSDESVPPAASAPETGADTTQTG
jgi:hypothetical protein